MNCPSSGTSAHMANGRWGTFSDARLTGGRANIASASAIMLKVESSKLPVRGLQGPNFAKEVRKDRDAPSMRDLVSSGLKLVVFISFFRRPANGSAPYRT